MKPLKLLFPCLFFGILIVYGLTYGFKDETHWAAALGLASVVTVAYTAAVYRLAFWEGRRQPRP